MNLIPFLNPNPLIKLYQVSKLISPPKCTSQKRLEKNLKLIKIKLNYKIRNLFGILMEHRNLNENMYKCL